MKKTSPERTLSVRILCITVLALLAGGPGLIADQIDMHNGDHYNGKLIGVTTNTVVFQSDVLGKIMVPREKVASIVTGTKVVTNVASAAPATATPVLAAPVTAPASPAVGKTKQTDLAAAIQQLGSQPGAVDEVQKKFLNGTDPAVNDKFNQVLNGLTTGQIKISDLRSQAKSAADQLRAMKKELGNSEATDALDGYLAVLDTFLKETVKEGYSTNVAKSLPGKSEESN